MNTMLLLVDPQYDFIDGTLPVPGADEAMDGLASFMKAHSERYVLKVMTADYHPYRHCSFSGSGGQWPRHCVQESRGAALYQPLLEALNESAGETVVLHKGDDLLKDEYSIFQNPQGREKLIRLIAEHDIELIEICGLAGDVCVLNTLKDGVELYGAGKFSVLEDFAPSLDGGKALKNYLDAFKG